MHVPKDIFITSFRHACCLDCIQPSLTTSIKKTDFCIVFGSSSQDLNLVCCLINHKRLTMTLMKQNHVTDD